MLFGTKVTVTRGSPGHDAGTPGCFRHVKGVLVGAIGNQVYVRLSEDDKHDTVGWCKAGMIGHWDRVSVNKTPKAGRR